MLLVTGATGFIGKNLIPALTTTTQCRILVRRTSNIELFKKNPNVEIAYGDLEKNVGIEEALDGVDIAIHCAVKTIGKNFIEFYRTNTIGTVHLMRAMKKQNVEKVLYISSNAACGPCLGKKPLRECDQPKPISFYGTTKQLAEDIIIKSGIHYIILRPAAVYGPYDIEILKYIKLLNYGIFPVIGFGEKYINLIYVADLVHLMIALVKTHQFNDQIFFVNDGHCYSYNEVVEQIAHLLHKSNLKIRIPEPIAHFCALLNDVFLPAEKRLIWRDKVKELAQNNWLCCNDEITAECNFVPRYTLKQGMRETIEWYRNRGYLK